MHLVTVGLNHKTAPVEVRECLAFSGDNLAEGMLNLVRCPHVQEGVILSTCNRTEVYGAVDALHAGVREITDFLRSCLKRPDLPLEEYLYTLSDLEVVQHLFSVAAGLDSMILGEAQILGQVKNAFHLALERGAVALHLGKLFRHAIEVGKRVRTETEIGESAVSVSYAAVELARKIFGELEGKGALVIGAGEMSELTAKNLVAHGVSRLRVVNRTYERACQLAQEFGGQAVPWENLREALVQTDIVISSTGAPQVILGYELVREVMWARRNRPLFLIDIAVPRDIDPRAHELDGVYLYNIDDLQAVVEANLRKREQEVVWAEQIIAEEVRAFSEWWAAREVVPLIRALKERGREIQQQELEKLFRKIPHLSEREKNLISAMSHAIVNKLLHHPVVFLKEIACEKDNARYLTMARNLFNLELMPEESKAGEQATEGAAKEVAEKAGEAESVQSRRSLYVKGG